MKMIVSTVPDVWAFAFIVPVYDYTDVYDLSPALCRQGDCVGWQAWGWDAESQQWERIGILTDEPAEARRFALDHQKVLMGERDIAAEPVTYMVDP